MADGIIDPKHELNLALNQASLRESVELVKQRLAEGANPNWRNPARNQYLNTALHNAAFKGNAEICKVLVNAGCDMEIENKFGNKPLMFAAYYGNDECAATLLKLGADVTAYSSKTGLTALHKACMQGHVKMVEILLENGAFPLALDKKGRTPDQVIGIEGERKTTKKDKVQVSVLLGGGGQHIYSALHKDHELAFTLAFKPGVVCSHCANQVEVGTPIYACPECEAKAEAGEDGSEGWRLCQACLDDERVMQAGNNNQGFGAVGESSWFGRFCICFT
mmetsp:Transcript_35316/g.61674  ORF Transcript_35316/g.61674 Transcript_35316/m.61674 type:complete len:278 (+) Transcript_35316:66-899(+)